MYAWHTRLDMLGAGVFSDHIQDHFLRPWSVTFVDIQLPRLSYLLEYGHKCAMVCQQLGNHS
jgi:hypothetical protein